MSTREKNSYGFFLRQEKKTVREREKRSHRRKKIAPPGRLKFDSREEKVFKKEKRLLKKVFKKEKKLFKKRFKKEKRLFKKRFKKEKRLFKKRFKKEKRLFKKRFKKKKKLFNQERKNSGRLDFFSLAPRPGGGGRAQRGVGIQKKPAGRVACPGGVGHRGGRSPPL